MNLFAKSLSHDLRAYLYHRFFLRTSLLVGNVFAWLLVLEITFLWSRDLALAIGATSLLYAVSHALTFFLLPVGARALSWGTRRAMLWGVAAHIVSLFAIALALPLSRESGEPQWLPLVGFVVLSALYRALYVTPYNLNTELNFSAGKSLAGEVLLSLIPLFAGGIVLSHSAGSFVLLVLASLCACVSALLLLIVPTWHEMFTWRYGETFCHLFSLRQGHSFACAIFSGIQGAGLLFAWPMAIFLMLGGSYYLLGAVMSVTLFCIFFIRLLGRVTGTLRKPSVPMSLVVGSSWALRFFAFTPVLYVAADILQHTGAGPRSVHIDATAYEQDADAGSYIDEVSVLKEMGLSLGRVLLTLLMASSAFFLSPVGVLGLAVACAGVASLIHFTIRPDRA